MTWLHFTFLLNCHLNGRIVSESKKVRLSKSLLKKISFILRSNLFWVESNMYFVECM